MRSFSTWKCKLRIATLKRDQRALTGVFRAMDHSNPSPDVREALRMALAVLEHDELAPLADLSPAPTALPLPLATAAPIYPAQSRAMVV